VRRKDRRRVRRRRRRSRLSLRTELAQLDSGELSTSSSSLHHFASPSMSVRHYRCQHDLMKDLSQIYISMCKSDCQVIASLPLFHAFSQFQTEKTRI
jgi:hypothetical protein